MKGLIVAVAAALVLSIMPSGPASNGAGPSASWSHLQLAENCPKSGEVIVGAKKLCQYACGTRTVVKEVDATDLCLGSMGG